ncbi:putative sulfatase [Roseimicrobium gellanilyticum]|uniref:Putative sulfatase n=1 Tax=Roseimicrobium gellanilyticum TaxID=748857 RepID=A0A366HDC8_9BACT|nr:sulfatase [Roseimicrobium gellanilyticum]RBP40461.1 putative sulfatase [Roseimicrobium gellanilyticum]
MRSFVLLLLLFAVPCPRIFAAEKPNIIIILADDLGWADLPAYGHPFHETPHLDRLVKEGMRFTQFYAGPVCSPTRANLQSGQDQARFGITQHIPGHRRPFAKLSDPEVPRQLPLEVKTFAERLGAAGYKTGYFGKWHLGGEGFGPEKQGWQTALEAKGNVASPKVNGKSEAERMADFLSQKATAFIEEHKKEPFLLQVSHAAVHIPLSTTPALQAKYEGKAKTAGYPCNPTYAGLLEELDQSVGRIMDTVERTGLAERTLIIFLSDNGGLEHEQSGKVVTTNRPLRGEKGMLYEGGIRVPAIMRWTSHVPPGSVCDVPAITMDVYPTLMHLAGVNLEEAGAAALDGTNLATLLQDPRAPLSRETLCWHLPHYHHSTPASAIRRGDWKLIEFFESGDLELYHLKADPGEKLNMAEMEKAKTEELRTALVEWRQKVGARMPVPNPNYDAARADELGKGKREE